jgi:putative transposase
VAIAGPNVPDAQLLAATIDAVVVERPEPEPEWPQHLGLDKGYDNETGWDVIADYDYQPHVRLIRDLRPLLRKPCKPRRWVVERTLVQFSS